MKIPDVSGKEVRTLDANLSGSEVKMLDSSQTELDQRYFSRAVTMPPWLLGTGQEGGEEEA